MHLTDALDISTENTAIATITCNFQPVNEFSDNLAFLRDLYRKKKTNRFVIYCKLL